MALLHEYSKNFMPSENRKAMTCGPGFRSKPKEQQLEDFSCIIGFYFSFHILSASVRECNLKSVDYFIG